ncbi:hypothetical protein JCM17380_16080 [Desulfosporosinus burensis]
MEFIVIDFDSWGEVSNCKELSQQKIDENDFKLTNSLGSKKSIIKQLDDSTYFVSINDDHFHTRMLLTTNSFILHKHSKPELQIDSWNKAKLMQTPHDVLRRLGFEVVDKIQHQLEALESFMDLIEEQILENPQKSQQIKIIRLHRKAIRIKKQINSHLSVFIRAKQDNPMWNELVQNVQSELDNARQLVELMENLREAYQASVDNKANDIMKILAILATILLPINLLTSFFGMNFTKMPLIHYQYGVYVLYGLVVILVASIIIAFKKNNWL